MKTKNTKTSFVCVNPLPAELEKALIDKMWKNPVLEPEMCHEHPFVCGRQMSYWSKLSLEFYKEGLYPLGWTFGWKSRQLLYFDASAFLLWTITILKHLGILSLLPAYLKKEVGRSQWVEFLWLEMMEDINSYTLKALLGMRTSNCICKTVTSYVMLGEKMKQFREHNTNRNGIYYKWRHSFLKCCMADVF